MEYMEYKIVALEGKDVGKSDLLKDYAGEIYTEDRSEDSLHINGVKPFIKDVKIKKKTIRLCFWKINMESKFALLNPQKIKYYIKDSAGAILNFDTSDYTTLKPLVDYIKIIKETAGDIPIILVGNQLDLDCSCEVSTEDGESFVENYDLTAYSGICVKFGKNVDELFEKLANILNERYEEQIPLM